MTMYIDRTLPLFLLLDLSFNQLSAIVYNETILIPVTTLKINQLHGFIIMEWRRTTIEAIDAKAAKTLICPTLKIKLGIVFAPIKYPTNYPDNIIPVAVKLNSSATALTPSKEL